MPLFFIFIVVPLIELMILIEIGSVIGSLWTFIIILSTAIIGAKLVRQQGLQTWGRIQQQLAQGEIPAQSLFDGICILISGVLLLTPGYLTDIIGILLLTPPFRAIAYANVGHRIKIRTAHSSGFGQTHSHFESQEQARPQQSTTLEGEYTRKD
jgi:UPF0716 protein FxsA